MDYSDIRYGLWSHLCTQITAVSSRVFWGWTAPADTPKPYITMSFSGELPSTNSCALFQQLDVEVYGDESNIMAIDPVADAIVTALRLPITTPKGKNLELDYLRDARFDAWNEELRVSMIRVRFLIPSDLW